MPDVVMPRLSDTMEEGVLTRWLKTEGDEVHRGDVLAEIETDKATMELEAYDEGVLQRLLVAEGTTAPIGEPLAVIGSGPPAVEPGAGGAPETAPSPAPAEPAPTSTEPAPAAPVAERGKRPRTSPLARKVARDHGLDLAKVTGTGPDGRILRVDVEAAVAAAEAAPGPAAEAPAAAPEPAPPVAPPAAEEADVTEVRLTAVRRVTAQRLTESAAAPHFYLTSVVEVGKLLAFRAEINERLAGTGTKVSVTDLLVRACAVTLREHPRVNSAWAGDRILRHHRVHIGVAVALDDGLIVPVIRDADRKSLREISAEVRELAERARAGKLAPDEFRGGTFSISNLGMYGVDHFTAILNPPEAAILAVGAASDEPVPRDGRLATRTTIKLTLSIDHRVLDGAVGAAYLRDLKETLQEPLRIVV